MFCPKCATQNLDGASFCRTCGANISLVPQALTGQMIQTPPPAEEVLDESCNRRGRKRELTLDTAFKNMFIGVAFLIELDFLNGRSKLAGEPVYSVLRY